MRKFVETAAMLSSRKPGRVIEREKCGPVPCGLEIALVQCEVNPAVPMTAIFRIILCLLSASIVTLGQQPAASAKAEDSIVGTWIWPDNHRVIVRADGTGESHKGPKMTWKFLNNKEVERKYQVIWDGGINVDAMLMSRDGKKMDGKRLDGTKFAVRRVSDDAKQGSTR